jgi:CRP/FNR family transcriptional regulator, cyclic AMP receptor protein
MLALISAHERRFRPVTDAHARDVETHGALLDLDPDLGTLLSGERATAAQRDIRIPLRTLAPGEFDPDALMTPCAANVGVLVISGVVIREVAIDHTSSAELLGSGDLIRPVDPTLDGVACGISWSALTPVVVSPMGLTVATALCRYPEVLLALLERTDSRAQRLSINQAVSQLTGVDHRIEALLRHLAARWGKVRPDGVRLPLALSHRMLGHLIGARRPTVSTAVALLTSQRRVTRLTDGTWLLHDSPTEQHRPEPSRLTVGAAG